MINGADTAWMLTSTVLVLFMTLPGLALFYAGLVRAKNIMSVLMHCVAVAALVSVLWFAGGSAPLPTREITMNPCARSSFRWQRLFAAAAHSGSEISIRLRSGSRT